MSGTAQHRSSRTPRAAGWALIGTGVGLTVIILVLPLLLIVRQALGAGISALLQNIREPDTLHALLLTCIAAVAVLPLNFAIGLSGAWLVAYHRFPGRKLLLSVSKIPISLSPIVAGVAFMMLYGQRGWFGPWLTAHDIHVVFALPAILLATLFVSFPYLLNQLVPLMESLGHDEEIVADQLGASGWTIFWRVTFPKIRWTVVYGLILANARALGEFGAVSVVSGHIRGQTNTLALQLEVLYQDYNAAGAFSAAGVLALLALSTLAAKALATRLRARATRTASAVASADVSSLPLQSGR